MTELNGVVSAEIAHFTLINVLNAAKKGFQKARDEAGEQRERDITEMMKQTKRKWLFGPRRNLTRTEAQRKLWYMDGHGFGLLWKAYVEQVRAEESIQRIDELLSIISSEKLMHVRLAENDLKLLREYL